MAKNRPRRAFIILLFRLASLLVLIIPIRIGLVIGSAFGTLSFYVLKKERQRALKNLDFAFPDTKTIQEKRKIAKKVFENLGKNFVEAVSILKFSREGLKQYICCRNPEILRKSAQGGKGAIILSAHFGNWEIMAHYLSLAGFPMNVIARRARMDGMEAFLTKIRRKNNVRVLYRDSSAKEIVDLLKNGEFVGIMPDQDMDSVSGVFVDFFGKNAWTPNGPAVLSILTGAQIVPCFIARRKYGHEVFIEKPLELVNTGDRKKDIVENTQRYTKAIEDYIRRFPEQWVWFHDRWKTKEPLNYAEAVARFTRN